MLNYVYLIIWGVLNNDIENGLNHLGWMRLNWWVLVRKMFNVNACTILAKFIAFLGIDELWYEYKTLIVNFDMKTSHCNENGFSNEKLKWNVKFIAQCVCKLAKLGACQGKIN